MLVQNFCGLLFGITRATMYSQQTVYLFCHAESEAQQDVLHSFGEAKGLAFSRDGKLLAVGVQDAVHIHEWPSLVHKASIRSALHAGFRCSIRSALHAVLKRECPH